MTQTPPGDHFAIEIESANVVLREAWPTSCIAYFELASSSSGVALLLTVAALILPPLLLWAIRRYRKMQDENRIPFPFLELPQELRDMVYENLIEEPAYPPPSTSPAHTSSMNWMLPLRWPSPSPTSQQPKRSNWILLANKQINREFMDLLCKRTRFHLTVSPQNYQNPCASPTSTAPSNQSIWKIGADTLKQIRSCDLKLVTTSAMLGVTDPRNMSSSDWTLARQIRQELTALTNVSSLTLDAKALGDPLWNPLWIWYHACQSFKNMGTAQSDTDPVGPQLKRITFSLDSWSPGENYMARDASNKGAWTWYCVKGHNVGVDGVGDVTVREFCGKLYQDCRICRPEMDSDDEEN
ncbi:hypothetical protein IQ06DRAFT_290872 [Phaeosphaeriaceae sp. SRC1lsM3a]|nr:hypothetical protein IQ06DRAFT_290872 [Stagonospora sp. SRC1lsM3a]